tara:strand:- start:3571 stop:5643 length:2073 start_codon:yes stop_codon:yes gene_type:complete
MSIDRIYREFSGVALVIFSLFLITSLFTFSPQDDVQGFLADGIEYSNSLGYLGALFSSTMLFYLGYASYYFALMLSYFGIVLFVSSTSSNFFERINLFNRFMLSLISIFPLAVFYASFFNDIGGIAGESLLNSMGTYLNKFWFGSLSIIIFLSFQYLVFYDFIKFINVLNNQKQTKSKKVPDKKPIVKEVKKTEAVKKTEIKKPSVSEPIIEIQEQKDFLDLLDQKIDESADVTKEYLEDLSNNLVIKLEEFGIEGKVEGSFPGPVITRFEINLAPGTKASQVTNIANDLARSLAVKSVRVVEVIEGKSSIGIEIPNPKRKVVTLYSTLHEHSKESLKPLEFSIGRDIAGESSKIDLQQLPHLLIAGTTGSGKSVGVNSILLNLLRNNSPKDLRLLLIDPKMLELSVYDDIPHLITPVVTDMQKAANGLNWCVKEMDKRYKLMSALGVRSLESYNQKALKLNSISQDIKEKLLEINDGEIEPLPYIVIVIDELADLMMVAGKKVEQLISRLAQKARASGMHLVVSTQRPSVDVITGLIKANIPSRISFLVSSKIDSRTILDQGGAEQLLGNGDMLFVEPGTSIPKRIHGAFVSDDEVQKIAKYLRETGKPSYIEEVIKSIEVQELSDDSEIDDDLYNEAVEFVIETRRASISSVQRKFRIGYNRAARLIEAMEENGIVSPMNSNGSREVL